MAFNVGDQVLVQGQPGQVIQANNNYTPPIYLVLIQQPIVRWFATAQISPAVAPAPTPTTPTTPTGS